MEFINSCKKNYVLGFVYLLTFGLFGIGWIIDIVKAVSNLSVPHANNQVVQQPIKPQRSYDNDFDEEDETEEQDENRIQFSVAGVTFSNDDGYSRQDILKSFYDNRGYSKKDIKLVPYIYNGENAIYVYARNQIIGNVPKEKVEIILENINTIRIYHFRVKMNNKGIYYSVIDLFLK